MVDVGKREDRMLDVISSLQHQRDQTRAALDFYTEAQLIPAEVSSHLWEILSGLSTFDAPSPSEGEEGNHEHAVAGSGAER